MMIRDYCISPEASILEAMKQIDRAAIASVVVASPDGKAFGILTDGDIRRALIHGASLNDPIHKIYTRKFVSVEPGVPRVDVLDIMRPRLIEQIPIVDGDGCLRGIHTLREILGSEVRPNWAVVMAGGKGTRLGSITENLPKPMVKVAGRPILERIVLHLVSNGIRRIFLSINYLGHIIEHHFGTGEQFGCEIEYLREETPLGTGGAISLLPSMPQDPVFVMNGDLILQLEIGKILDFHKRGGYFATMGLKPYSHEIAFGCVEIDGPNLVGLEEKPTIHKMINAGVYVLSPEAIVEIPKATFFPVTRLFEEAVNNRRSCGAYVIEQDWIDVGNPRELIRANGLA